MITTNAHNLTRKQQSLYEHLLSLSATGAPAPTLDELCKALGLQSRGSLHKHITGLIEAGLVEPMERKQRGVRLTEYAEQQDGIAATEVLSSYNIASNEPLPLMGDIAAGKPIEAMENPEPMEVPWQLRGAGECYVLRVRGDSMIDDGIFDGDWVVIEKREHARNGEVVVALVDNAEATLKRIEQHPDRIILHPANAGMQPMIYQPQQVAIQGVLVGQMRQY